MNANQIETLRKRHTSYNGKIHSIDGYIDAARRVCMHNETLYLIDCSNTDVLCMTNNGNKTLGIKDYSISNFEDLYHHIPMPSTDKFFQITEQILTVALCSKFDNCKDDVFSILYQTTSGEIIYKRTKALFVDENGETPYTMGSLQNVTAHFIGQKEPTFDVNGPNAEAYRPLFMNLGNYVDILSSREIEILFLIGKGLKSHQIGDKLFISKHTVDKHRKNIIKKLESTNSIDAYNKATEMGLLNHSL